MSFRPARAPVPVQAVPVTYRTPTFSTAIHDSPRAAAWSVAVAPHHHTNFKHSEIEYAFAREFAFVFIEHVRLDTELMAHWQIRDATMAAIQLLDPFGGAGSSAILNNVNKVHELARLQDASITSLHNAIILATRSAVHDAADDLFAYVVVEGWFVPYRMTVFICANERTAHSKKNVASRILTFVPKLKLQHLQSTRS